ncbi:zinc finger matrin-type protein [Ceraceosorus bombacis]|uniref:Zinc finger matrin-type protein n=1 Tax=Ceraceosorus bombacis TaxID=401625 RepID=A0A0P1BF08_9BASI|nr:zinc finger matrin-type protein [Ceraceosorus bombacis]
MSGIASGTAAGGSGVGPSRRRWDKEEFENRAKARDEEDRERAKENEQRIQQGKKPTFKRKEDLPKPTELLQARKEALELDKDVGKSQMVDVLGDGRRGGPGYYCDVCKRTCKDSIGYLDHINGRMHLRRIGQTTQVARSSVAQVRARIMLIRAEREAAGGAAKGTTYDFEARIEAIAKQQRMEKEARRAKKKELKTRMQKGDKGLNGGGDEEMMKQMGFAGFGKR